ncbi:MAG: hypothetical protein NPIRA02_05040 [Nitrospirales bacterium]|nr:MAG: hypothetical protein NPIRA02_05040 [Nitrospirales bacterium]
MKNTPLWLDAFTRIYPFSQSHTLLPVLVLECDDFMSHVSQALIALSVPVVLGSCSARQCVIVTPQAPWNVRTLVRFSHKNRP